MVRSHGRVQIQMDARPQILPNGDIRLTMGLEYSPRVLEPDSAATWSSEERVLAGTLTLSSIAGEGEGDDNVFDPMRLTAGIEELQLGRDGRSRRRVRVRGQRQRKQERNGRCSQSA